MSETTTNLTSYQRARAEACEWCAKGGYNQRAFNGDCHPWGFPCTAPTRDQFEAKQAEEIVRLREEVARLEVAVGQLRGDASYPGHYVSTACQIGKHEHCRLSNKWSGEACQCKCGHALVDLPTYEDLQREVNRMARFIVEHYDPVLAQQAIDAARHAGDESGEPKDGA